MFSKHFSFSFEDVENEKQWKFHENYTTLQESDKLNEKRVTSQRQSNFLFGIYQSISQYRRQLRTLQIIQREIIR